MGDEKYVWLVLGSVIATLIPSIFYGGLRTCSRVYTTLHGAFLQYTHNKWTVSEQHLERADNLLESMPRHLEQIGLCTGRFIGRYDVNPDMRDNIQWGFIRIPTKSWILWSLTTLQCEAI